MLRRSLLVPLVIAALVGAAPLRAATDSPTVFDASADYESCMKLMRRDPASAFEFGNTWILRGGGLPARHCIALSLLRLGHPAEAGKRLEDLAVAVERARPDLVADVLAQSGTAWATAGDYARANAVQTSALKFRPDDPDILMDRAQTLAAARNYRDAIDDLDRAIALAPNRPEGYVLRASALRFTDDLDRAASDLEQAIRLDPQFPDAFLERGMVRRLRNDGAGARADWMRVLSLSAEGEAADAARANLAKLDVKIR